MNEEKLEAKILDFAIENAKNPFPNAISYGVLGNSNIFLDNTIFSRLEGLFIKNGVVSPENEAVNAEVVNASRASAFAASAICQLYVAEKIKKNIDLFVNDEKNNKFFDEFDEERKKTFIRELKGKVTARLEVDAKTDFGKDLVQKLSDKLNEMKESSKGNYSENNGPAEKFLGDGLGAVVSLNEKLSKQNNLIAAVDAVKKQYVDLEKPFELGHEIENLIWDHINDNASHLADELAGMAPVVDAIQVGGEALGLGVTVESFIKNYKSDSLTNRDMEWANTKLRHIEISDIDEVLVDGNISFTKDSLTEENAAKIRAYMLGDALTGKKVTYKDYKTGTESVVTPNILDGRTPVTFWEKFCDFIKNLFGLDMITSLKHDIAKAKESHLDNDKVCEKMSFEEFSGINNLKKVKTSSEKHKEPTAERSNRTIGG